MNFREYLVELKVETNKKLNTKKRTNSTRDIFLNKESTGWSLLKVKRGWKIVDFDDNIQDRIYMSIKIALANTGLDWK